MMGERKYRAEKGSGAYFLICPLNLCYEMFKIFKTIYSRGRQICNKDKKKKKNEAENQLI